MEHLTVKIENYKYSIKEILSHRDDRKEVEEQILKAINMSASHWRKLKNLRVDSPRQMRGTDMIVVARILGVSVEDLINQKVFS